MEVKNEFELMVSQGRRPIWMIILATIFFTVMVYCLYEMLLMFWQQGFCEYTGKALPHFLQTAAICFSGGVTFSVIKTVLIDLDKNKLISRYHVGLFSYDATSEVPELDYVSVFLDASDYYQINLWYKGNKHYKMYSFEDKAPAFQFASQVAIKLNIDMLDATEKGNFRRIDKNIS